MGLASPRRLRALVAVLATGAAALALGGASAPKKRQEPPPPKVEETIGDLAFIQSKAVAKLEGVGLVVGLDGTGAEPPPSEYRTRLVDDMRKAGVENPNQILRDPRVALVLVKLEVPPGVSPKDRLDATIELPPASGVKSLAGGYLLSCRLREHMLLKGGALEGHEFATAQGPVMTGAVERPGDLKVGRVLGGGRVRKEIPFQLILHESRKSFRVSALVEGVVNQRFSQTEGVDQKGAALAKTDQYLVLKVPRVYHDNPDRFFRVIKLLPVIDSPTLRTQRLEQWGRELLDPTKAGVAALRLEGLGQPAVDTLKTALANPNAQVRFFAAETLAYLNDPAGAEVLGETARTRPEFRAFALAALASNELSLFHMTLRKLMDEPDVTLRYGAFNALRTLASDDAFLGQVRVLADPAPDPAAADDDQEDAMAVAIARRSAQRRRDDPFSLFIVDCEGPPMVHVARTRRCEVVVFGRGMKLLPPIVLGDGPYLLNASDGDQEVEICKIVPSRFSDSDQRVRSTLELGDVIRRAANLGATYPEIVKILEAAQRQRNLAGPLVVDAVPGASPAYLEAQLAGRNLDAKKDDAVEKSGLSKPEDKTRRRGLFDWFRRGR
jgi:hypothetical protein